MLLKEGNRKRGRCFSEDDMGLERERRKQEVELGQDNVDLSKYGDGVSWCRGSMIGKGSFGSVYLANLKKPKSRYSSFPSVMAVKSAEVSVSGSIQKEREVLNNVKGCANVIKCYGEETTNGEKGEMVYNLLLEYGSGGTLADVIEKSGCNGLPEFEVRCYTRSILRGLCHIHDCGYVHCDLKPENVLLVETTRKGAADFRAKIGDLGLAKRDNQSKKKKLDPYWRGTPMYLSPEAVVDGLQGPPSDVWALGCIVLEMLTGKPPWVGKEDFNAKEILRRIGEGNELPNIPSSISKEGRSFLKGCFVRKPMYRLTAEMLLIHPFVEGLVDDDNDEVEELEEVPDINVISSMSVLSETDEEEELSCSSFSDDWSYVSEEEFFSSWSEEDADDVGNQVGPSFCENGAFEVQENRDVTSNAVRPYPITFTISAGV